MRNICFLLIAILFFSCSSDETPVSEEDSINFNDTDSAENEPIQYPEFINDTFNYQGQERVYSLHIPDSFDGTRAAPLVVFLHGGGGNAQSAQGFTNFNAVSEENGFLMLYPQAGFEFPENSFIWADGRGLAPDEQGIDDVGFVNSLVEQLKSELNINEQKVYLCGFSNGSFLAQRIAFEESGQFAAIGTLGGTMSEKLYENGNPSRAIPMLYVFGTDDPLVPSEGGFVSDNPDFDPVVGIDLAVEFWVRHNECQVALPEVSVTDSNINDNSTVDIFEYVEGVSGAKVKYYRVNGGGHTWPGVQLTNQELGEVNLDIQASEELWDFFDQFELTN